MYTYLIKSTVGLMDPENTIYPGDVILSGDEYCDVFGTPESAIEAGRMAIHEYVLPISLRAVMDSAEIVAVAY